MKNNKNTRVIVTSLISFLIAASTATQSRAQSNTVVSWGDRTDVPGNAKNVRAISAGWEHTLAIAADGSLLDWGNDSEAPPPGLTNVIAIAAGWRHNLAVRGDGTVVVWGDRAWRTPFPDGLTNIIAVSANGDDDGEQSLALARDGSVFSSGEVSDVPADLTNAIAIAAGGWHNVALRSDGTVTAWGDDTFGQTDLPDGLTNVIAIASGDWHSLALKADGTVVSWGLPGVGDQPVPEGVTNVVAISAGQYYNLALKRDGTVVGWGLDFGSNVGQTNIPSDLKNVTAISAGVGHAVAISRVPNVFYVDLNSTNPTPPYTNLSTAATDIQSAIDAASDGDKVLVNDGTYQTGGRTVYGLLTNRVVIDKAITVQSLNGPGATIIKGYQVPGDIYGTNAVRCVYLTNYAVLIGFTITNGSTRSGYYIDTEHLEDGGGIWCESTDSYISNCVVTGNSAWDAGAGVRSGTLDRCLITGNSTPNAGGGALYGILNDCVISNNFAQWGGGGVYGNPPWAFGPPAFVNRCLVINNYTYNNGGGVYGSTCTSCQLIGNSAIELPDYYYAYGGAAEDGLLINCTLKNNHSDRYGGAADLSHLQGCLIMGNDAGAEGGGVNNCQSANCTIVNNSAGISGGGANYGVLNNCIVYYNTAPTNGNFFDYRETTYNIDGTIYDFIDDTTLNNCCTFPMPTYGTHTFTNAPLLVDLTNGDFHPQSNSPCINSGNNAANSLTTDLAGNPRVAGGTIDVGCYEFQSPASKISYAWLSTYNLPLDGSADFVDSDGDGMNNWQEWRAGTDPSNSGSSLKLLSITNAPSGLTITWQSVQGVSYQVERTSDLSDTSTFSTIDSNTVGQPGTTSFTDSSATNAPAFFYRVSVQ
jgi:Regulator of Chromosome Condensation (RCC1) repeat protein